MIRHTSTAEAHGPLSRVSMALPRPDRGKVVLDAIRKHLDEAGKKITEVSAPPPLPSIDRLDILEDAGSQPEN